jgi:hypothetical protein
MVTASRINVVAATTATASTSHLRRRSGSAGLLDVSCWESLLAAVVIPAPRNVE